MDSFYKIAEHRITEAMKNGEFDNLEGKGKPFKFEDESMIPEDLRIAYRFLKNAGCVPPELETRNEIVNLCSLIKRVRPYICSFSMRGSILAISLMLKPEKTSSQMITSGLNARHRASSRRFRYPVGRLEANL